MTENSNRTLNAQQAVATRGHSSSTAFVCPYPDCGVFAQHHWGKPGSMSIYVGNSRWANRELAKDIDLLFARCEACDREVIYIDDAMIWPRASTAPACHADMPDDIRADFEEARKIQQDSPRGAAALLRLSLQKLLPHIGATKTNINDGIAELVAAGTVPQRVQQALDSVRVIGNEAVHPGELDLRDDNATVLTLFGLLNFIVEKAISEPKQIEAIYDGLPPSKLQGIENRDSQTQP